jgi:hypothetical protein
MVLSPLSTPLQIHILFTCPHILQLVLSNSFIIQSLSIMLKSWSCPALFSCALGSPTPNALVQTHCSWFFPTSALCPFLFLFLLVIVLRAFWTSQVSKPLSSYTLLLGPRVVLITSSRLHCSDFTHPSSFQFWFLLFLTSSICSICSSESST